MEHAPEWPSSIITKKTSLVHLTSPMDCIDGFPILPHRRVQEATNIRLASVFWMLKINHDLIAVLAKD